MDPSKTCILFMQSSNPFLMSLQALGANKQCPNPPSPQQRPHSIPHQLHPHQRDHAIHQRIEHLGPHPLDDPRAQQSGHRRQRQHGEGRDQRHPVELPQRRIGAKLDHIHDCKEDHARPGIDLGIKPQRQHIDLKGRPARMGHETREPRADPPETAAPPALPLRPAPAPRKPHPRDKSQRDKPHHQPHHGL